MSSPVFTLQILHHGKPVKSFTLKEGETCTIGRESCTINLPTEKTISGSHASVDLSKGRVTFTDSSSNGSYVGKARLDSNKPYSIEHGDEIGLAKTPYSIMLVLGEGVGQGTTEKKKIAIKPSPATAGPSPSGQPKPAPAPDSGRKRIRINAPGGLSTGNQLTDLLKSLGSVTIGRNDDCHIRLSSPLVSGKHAVITQTDKGIKVEDFSTNGTYINGFKINGYAYITLKETISIGPFKFPLSGEIVDYAESGEPAIIAENVMKQYDNGYVGLQRLNLQIPTKEFVALMGPSGCGKSTLLKCLNGDNPASEGVVTIQGLELNSANFNLLKRNIGYVPQDDIVHRELSVNDTLYYAAKLRLPDDFTDQEISVRIEKVLSDLNINDPKLRKNKVGELSGGQRKRISIAVELLNEPSILFLDEPTSPLDPETIGEFLTCIQKLAREGTTIIMVTHKPDDLFYVDKVIFLGSGGYLTYYGNSKKIYQHFSVKEGDIIQIYSRLNKKDTALQFYNKWRITGDNSAAPKRNNSLSKSRTESLFRQYYWLSLRYLKIKLNDRGNMALLLAQPVIIAGLITFIFGELQVGVLFLMAISAVWFGVSNAAKEIVGELPIYKRERMFNMSIWTYLGSKLTVLAIIALVQAVIYTSIIFMKYGSVDPLEGHDHDIALRSFTGCVWLMFYFSTSATLMGLFLSAVFKNTEKVMTFVPIALMPQIMLAGVVAKINNVPKELLSYLTFGRWGTESFARLQDDTSYELEKYTIAGTDTTFFNVVQPVPIPAPPPMDSTQAVQDSIALTPRKAIDILQFTYTGDLHWVGALSGTMIATLVLNVGMVVGIYWALKKKDSI